MNIVFFAGIGFQEVLLIMLIVLIFFGGKKIPELMHGFGKGIKSFKEGMNEVENISKDIVDDKTTKGNIEKQIEK